jgi:hypothetical protein
MVRPPMGEMSQKPSVIATQQISRSADYSMVSSAVKELGTRKYLFRRAVATKGLDV